MEQVFIVHSKMCPTGKVKKKAVPTGKKKKLLGIISIDETELQEEFVKTGESDCQVDTEALAQDLQIKLQELEVSGYSVINITPIISGSYGFKAEWSAKYSAGYGYGYGFSYTAGMMIIARKLESYTSTRKAVS